MRLLATMMLGVLLPFASPPRASGELTEGERWFQGVWELRSRDSGNPTGTLRIEARDFRAETVHGDYQGYVTIRPDASPPEIDFTIERCECKFEGMTSAGIYSKDGDAFLLALPSPGEPRPAAFDGLDEAKFMIERATRSVE